MPERINLYIVLDANILTRDFWMTGKEFSYLRNHQFLCHKIVIPEVAYKEAKNNLRRRAEDLISNVKESGKRSTANHAKLIRLFNYKRLPDNPKWDVNNLLVRWNKHIKSVLKESGGGLIPTPEVKIDELLKRSIDRKKPFSRGDKGFRDTLIWLSTLDLIQTQTRVSFVTQNTSDFFEKGSSEPHPEILQEAKLRIKGEWNMLFHRSLGELIAKFDSDKSASGEALKHALLSERLTEFSLWDWLESNLPTVIGEEDFDGIRWAGVSYHAEAPTLISVEELISLDIPRSFQYIGDDVYRFYCDVGFIGWLRCQILLSPTESLISPRQMLWKDEKDTTWTYTDIRATCTFAVSIDFNARDHYVVESLAIPLLHWQSYDDVIDGLEEERKYMHDPD